MRIRRVHADEGDRLRAIRVAALSDAPEAFGETLESARAKPDAQYAERTAAAAAGTERALFVAEDEDGEWVGIVGGVREPGYVYLVSMWVSPAHRRTGVGAALVQQVTAWAGALDVRLHVTDTMLGTHAFYSSLGFEFTGTTEAHGWNPDLRELEMVLAWHPVDRLPDPTRSTR